MPNCANCKINLPDYNVKFCSDCGGFLNQDDFGVKEDLDWDLKHPVEIDPLILSNTTIFLDTTLSTISFTCQNCDYKIPNAQSNFCENCGTKIVSLVVGFEGVQD